MRFANDDGWFVGDQHDQHRSGGKRLAVVDTIEHDTRYGGPVGSGRAGFGGGLGYGDIEFGQSDERLHAIDVGGICARWKHGDDQWSQGRWFHCFVFLRGVVHRDELRSSDDVGWHMVDVGNGCRSSRQRFDRRPKPGHLDRCDTTQRTVNTRLAAGI